MPISFRPLVLAGACLFAAPLALAQAAPGSAERMQAERAACDGSKQDVAACQREAGAARDEARRGNLAPAPNADANALARCQSQPAAARADCEARLGAGSHAGHTTTSGSVSGGGVLRETVTPVK